MNELVITLVTILLSSGGALFLRNLLKGLGSLRGGARAREREAIADLAKSRADEADRAEWAEADRDFWRDTAGRWRYQLVKNGIDPVPPDPEPPSARRGRTKPSKQQ